MPRRSQCRGAAVTLCEFTETVQQEGNRTRYRCPKCGRVTSLTQHAPAKIHATCGVVDNQHWIICPHRGQVLATINAKKAGCGCASSTVDVYQCERFNEPVLKQSADRCREAVAAEIPGYTGRTCRECTEYD